MSAHLTNQPSLTVDELLDTGSVAASLRGLDPDLMVLLRRYGQTGESLQSLLRVNLAQTGAPSDDDIPDILGHLQILEGALRFTPRFPFEPGLSYRVRFDPRPLGRTEFSQVLTFEFSLPRAPSGPPTEVQHIFPSCDCLPENLLRFYVTFSSAMQRGRAEAEIALLGSDGRPAPDALYRAPVELWDRNMRILTILLDPGRLKRWVGPNRELGPPLRAGQEYTLAIAAGMLDIDRRRLPKTFYKRFRVTEAAREEISVEQWKVVHPEKHSRQPLILHFPRPLDWALLARTITVASTERPSIDGQVVIDQEERRWSFTPTSPWAARAYEIRVSSSLEDVCGNTIETAFDRPLRSGSDLASEAAIHSIPFSLVGGT